MRALKAFRTEALPAGQFEVIVADDGSSDGTEALVRSFEANYRIKYCFQEDKGFRAAAARNAGAKLADGEVLAFFDAGEIPSPSFAASHLSAHDRLRSARRAMIGLIYGWSTGVRPHAEGMSAEQLYRSIPKETDPRYQAFARVGFNLGRLPLPPLLFWTGNCSVRTEDFWEAGGFDESFSGYGLEDVDLGYRLWERGTSLALCKEGWAIELIESRNVDANDESSKRNMAKFLQNCDPLTPAREIIAMLVSVSLGLFFDLQEYYRALIEWEVQAKGIDVLQEVQSFCRALPPGKRVAILGVGSSIPESRPDAVLFDFDRQFIRTMQMPACGIHHRIGLRTGLPDNSVDSLLITSRMQGIWGRFGDPIMLEAKRVANDVRLAWN
jgi:glycosyltransferase involved in cell wall biosynthesis